MSGTITRPAAHSALPKRNRGRRSRHLRRGRVTAGAMPDAGRGARPWARWCWRQSRTWRAPRAPHRRLDRGPLLILVAQARQRHRRLVPARRCAGSGCLRQRSFDALGLPVRLIPTAGERCDSPQAAALVDGLDAVGHVIADAAYDSGALRDKIEEELGAEAHIRPTLPARSSHSSIPTSLPSATRSRTSFNGSSASAASPCAARRRSKFSWALSSSSQHSIGSDE